MDVLRVAGGRRLTGEVTVAGFKHLMVPAIAATLLLPRPVTLRNVPALEDARVLIESLRHLGADVLSEDGLVTIDTRRAAYRALDPDHYGVVHGSLYLVPALLGRFGRVEIGETGGCLIGSGPLGRRPAHHVREVLERFGASFDADPMFLRGHCERLRATDIDILEWSDERVRLTGPLVSGATKTAIIAALGCDEQTIIRHPYWKPDVIGLLEMLALAGASVNASRQSIEILPPKGSEPFTYDILSDISCVMTWLVYSAFTGSSVRVIDVRGDVRGGLEAELQILGEMGVEVSWENGSVIAKASTLHAASIEVHSMGIYSDHQPLFALLGLHAAGETRIHEAVWSNRFSYVSELQALGGDVAHVDASTIRIRPSSLREAPRRLHGRDLRAVAALLLAALAVDGVTEIAGASHLRRGYPDLVSDLQKLGAAVDYVS